MIESAELKEFRAEAANWLGKNKPKPPSFMLPESCLEVGNDDQFKYLKEWQQKVYQAGYLGLSWPKAYGGYGQQGIMQDIANEEMARARVPFMVNAIGLSWAGPTILKLGSEEQKKKYAKKILNAEEIWCQGFSEPDYGSDLASVQTSARLEGESYIINGRKIWSSLAAYSRHMILLARTNPEAPNKFMGLSFLLCPMDVPGIEVIPILKMTGEDGFCEVVFDDAAIPAEGLMGKEGQGWNVAMATLAFERGAAGGQGGGHLIDIITADDVVELSKNVQRDGMPAIEDPVVRDQLVELLIKDRIISLNRKRAKIDGLNRERPQALWLMEKLAVTEHLKRLTETAVKLQGAKGSLYMGDPHAAKGGFWQRSYMNSFSGTIAGGTSEVLRNIIGERLLDLPKG